MNKVNSFAFIFLVLNHFLSFLLILGIFEQKNVKMKKLTNILILLLVILNLQTFAQKKLFQENFDDNKNKWQIYNGSKLQIRNSELVLENTTSNSFANTKIEVFLKIKNQVNFSLKSKIRFLGNNNSEGVNFSFGSSDENPFGGNFYQHSLYMKKDGNLSKKVTNPFEANTNDPFAPNSSKSSLRVETNKEHTYILELLRIDDKIFSYINDVCIAWAKVENLNFEKIVFVADANSKIGIDYVSVIEMPQNYFSKQIINKKGRYIGKIKTLAYQLPADFKKGFLAYIDNLEDGKIIAVKDTKSQNSVAVSVVGKLIKFRRDYAQKDFEIRLTKDAMQRIGKTDLMPVEIEYNTEIGMWIEDLRIARDSNKVHIYHKLYNEYKNIDDKKALYYLNQGLNYAKAIRFHNGIATSYQLFADFNTPTNFKKPYHTVNKGETLYSIAKANNLDVYTLQRLNKLKELSIEVGQILKVSKNVPKKVGEMENYYLKSLEAQKQGKDINKLAVRYKLTGDFYADKLGNTQKARLYYQKWLEVREKQKNPTYLLWAYRFWGRFEDKQGNLDKSLEYFDKFLEVSKTNDSKKKYYQRVNYVGTYFQYINPSIAIKYLEEVFKYKKNTGQDYYSVEYSIRMAYLTQILQYKRAENLAKAIELYEIIVDRFNGLEDVLELLAIYKKQKEYKKYLITIKRYLNRNVQRYPKDRFPKAQFYEAKELSGLFGEKESLDMSIIFMEKWLEELKNPKYINLRLAILEQLRFAHQNYSKEFGKAAEYALKIHNLDMPKDTFDIVNSLDNIAFLYQKDKSYNEGLKYFNQALEIRTKQKNPILMAEQINKIGYLYEVQNSKKAKKYYKKALKLCQTKQYNKNQFTKPWSSAGNPETVSKQFKRIANFYQEQGNTKWAEKFEDISLYVIDKKDIVYTVKKGETLYAIAVKHGVRMKEIQIWNNLKGFSLDEGQKLTIQVSQDFDITKPNNIVTNPVLDDNISKSNGNPFKTNTTPPTPTTNPFETNPNQPQSNPFKTNTVPTTKVKIIKGLAEEIKGVSSVGRFVAFANNISQGTLITVKNLSNNEEVSAVVIGFLPTDTHKSVIIQLSPEAFKRLKTDEAQVEVKLRYE